MVSGVATGQILIQQAPDEVDLACVVAVKGVAESHVVLLFELPEVGVFLEVGQLFSGA